MNPHEAYTLGMQLVRVTEQAAIAAAEWVGRGNKEAADQAAVDAMRKSFDDIPISGQIVIGEGEMDEAPMLYIGERVGAGGGPEVDIAVDPLEGTNLVAKDQANAIAVFAMAPRTGLLHAPDMYMEKIAVGAAAKGLIDLDRPAEENAKIVAAALGKDLRELQVVLLDRPRHREMIEALYRAGAAVRLISDGDVSPALSAGLARGDVDMVLGTGGAPEGVLAAAAIRCLGGDFQARLSPSDDQEKRRAEEMMGSGAFRLLCLDDLVASRDVFFVASAITRGDLLPGVDKGKNRCTVHSMLLHTEEASRHLITSSYPIRS